MVKLPLAVTHELPLAGASAQVPTIKPLVSVELDVTLLKVPVTEVLVRVMVSPADDLKVNVSELGGTI